MELAQMSSLDNPPATLAAAPAAHDPLDLIWGAKDIGKIINKPLRATFHLLETGAIPAKKISGQWVASRRKLQDELGG
jgi:hypothetical protein